MLDALFKILSEDVEYQSLVKKITNGGESASMGIPRSARWFLLSALFTELKIPILIITDRTDRSLRLSDELRLWLPQTGVQYFQSQRHHFMKRLPGARWCVVTGCRPLPGYRHIIFHR